MELVFLAATVLFCAKDFNAAFRIRGWIWRSANPEPDLRNMFCATPFGDSLRIDEGKTNEKVLALSWSLLVVVICCVISMCAADRAATPKPSHPAFEKLKRLAGRWSGPAVWDQGGKKGNVDFNIAYRTTSGSKAVMETMFAGTPGEMVTMCFLERDDLALVHYCSAGNQPKMKLETPRDSNVLSFRCLGGTNTTEQDSHMH